MRLDRAIGEHELLRRLPIRVAAGDQSQHLAFARRQRVEVVVGRSRRAAGERVEHESGQSRTEDRVSARHPDDRVAERGSVDGLRHVAPGTGPYDADHVLGRVRHGQRQEPHRWQLLVHAADHLDATATRHVHVEQHDVRLGVEDDADGLVDVTGLADHLDRALRVGRGELSAHAAAHQRVVIDQDDSGRRHARTCFRIASTTSVPASLLRTVAMPPDDRVADAATVVRHGIDIEPAPAVTHEDLDLLVGRLREHRHRRCAR